MNQTVMMPTDRIGVLIGRGGSEKRRIEKRLDVEIEVDSKTGRVTISSKDRDVERVMKAVEFIRAVGYGFSPARSETLISEDVNLHVIDLTGYVGKDERVISRVKGRIIGEKGKTRRVIEETAKVFLSVYGHYAAIIGAFEGVVLASEAIRMLISGSPHKSVYNYLFDQRRRQKMEKMQMWK